MKTIRVSYCDPDATDSSSDDGSGKSPKRSKRKVHEIEVQQMEIVGDFREETGSKKPNLSSERGEQMVGIRTTRSGKFWAEIKDPIKGGWVWLGVFDTAETAYSAYLAQESKFAAAKWGDQQRVESAASQKSPVQDSHGPPTSAGMKLEGVVSYKSGFFGASIRDPFMRKRVCLGSFPTAEEASRAYLAKKAQLEAKQLRIQKAGLEAKMLRAQRGIDRPASGQSTRISGIWRTYTGRYSVSIRNPITKRRVHVGTFPSRPKARQAYRAKEAEFEEQLKAIASEKSCPVSSVIEIETSDLSNETGGVESVGENKDSWDQEEAGFGFFDGVQVVDKNGFLIGKFSLLDDLSICS